MNPEIIHTTGALRVRFAPSPTGIPHVGNIRTALFNYFLAKNKKGLFILRIEDTDQTRKVEGAIESIKESLEWLGAQWDEYVVQSERLDDYKKYAEDLVEKGFAREEEGAIRFIVPKDDKEISWTDLIGNKRISFRSNDVEDFIILKADGYPTYHLANVVDDHLMGITHVIRGEDWIPSTPKHILLYHAFGWNTPEFAHVPNVLGTDGKKLSKRRGAGSVLDFRKEGYLAEALLNYLMLLGWSPKDEREVLLKEEIENEFSLENVNSAPAIFDERKLQWMNGEHIRLLSVEELTKKLKEYDEEFIKHLSNTNLLGVIAIAQTRIKTLKEFKEAVQSFLEPEEIALSDEERKLRSELRSALEEISSWDKQSILDTLMDKFIKQGIKFPKIYRAAIGKESGLPLADFFEILGRNKTLNLLK